MPQHQPAPNGWADAYREIMEQIWQGVAEAGDHVLSHADITALAAYAAEIREGIAAGLVRAGTDPTTIRVPLVAVPPLAEQPAATTEPLCTDEYQPPPQA
jgi:peptidoglycan/xylan/chitin deacetylase (PgdA/CDA1 family)